MLEVTMSITTKISINSDHFLWTGRILTLHGTLAYMCGPFTSYIDTLENLIEWAKTNNVKIMGMS